MDQATAVELMGQYFAASGRVPMRGRVFGYLLSASPKRTDFKTIREELGASKSAVSLALTGLTDQGLVRARTRPGKRKRYFEVDVPGWLERSKREMRSAAEFNDILRGCKEARRAHDASDEVPSDERAAPLDAMIRFHEGYLRQVEAFISIWEMRE